MSLSVYGRSPLVELRDRLGWHGRVPLTWWLTHAPDGSLQALWDAETDGEAMAALLAFARHPIAGIACRARRRYPGPWMPGRELRRIAPEAPAVAALAAITEPVYRELPF